MELFREPISILLADDDKDDRFFFREAFREIKTKVNIETVSDGEQLIDHLSKPGIIYPHILFMDLNLPRKTGMECLEVIRNNSSLKDLIVAIYSTSASERDIRQAFDKKANLYIKKPNDYHSLIDVMKKVININWQTHANDLTLENFLISG